MIASSSAVADKSWLSEPFRRRQNFTVSSSDEAGKT